MSILERAAERMAADEQRLREEEAKQATQRADELAAAPAAVHANPTADAADDAAKAASPSVPVPDDAAPTPSSVDESAATPPARASIVERTWETVAQPATDAAVVVPPKRRSGNGKQIHNIDRATMIELGFAIPNQPETTLTRQLRRIKRPLLNFAKTSRLDTQGTGHPNIILITSSLPREGKTFMAVNLALSMSSEVDNRVLLVGADPFQYGSENVLGLPREPGLCEVLRGDLELEDAILDTDINGLQFLPAGSFAEELDELAASDSANIVFRQLSERDPTRIVIIDTAPVMARTEAVVLSRQAAQVVMIIESRRTPRSTTKETLNQLKGHPNVMAVLNKCTDRIRALDRGGYGYGYGYGYNDR